MALNLLQSRPIQWWLTRCAVLLLGALPTCLKAFGLLSQPGSPAHRPWWVDPKGPLPAFRGLELAAALLPNLVTSVVLGGVLVGCIHTMWQACFFEDCHKRRPPSALCALGWQHTPRFLVLGALRLLFTGLGWVPLGALAWVLVRSAWRAGWDAWCAFGLIPAFCVALGLVWFWCVGCVAWSAKIVSILEPHSTLRHAFSVGVRLMRGAWVAWVARFGAVHLGTTALNVLVWVWWRQSAPGSQGAWWIALWCAVWCACLATQSGYSVWLHSRFWSLLSAKNKSFGL